MKLIRTVQAYWAIWRMLWILAAMLAQTSVKARDTEQRLTDMLANGFSTGGPLYVAGSDLHVGRSHYVASDSHVSGTAYVSGDAHHIGCTWTGGASSSGDIDFNGHNLVNISEINTGHQPWGAHGSLYMNGYDIHLQGGTVYN